MKYKNIWYWDGSWRDIYVLHVTIADWQRLVDWLRTDPYPSKFYLNDEHTTLPEDVSTIFQKRNNVGVFLVIDVKGVNVHCHFFWPKEIEFDMDPREVDNEQKEQGIVDFMRALGTLLEKEVILTPENWKETSLLAYVPERNEIVHDLVPLEPTQSIELSREEGLKVLAEAYGVDEIDEAAIIRKALEAADKPAYEED